MNLENIWNETKLFIEKVITFERDLNMKSKAQMKYYEGKIEEFNSCDPEIKNALINDAKITCEAYGLLKDSLVDNFKFQDCPFFSKINLEFKELYISKTKSQLENNIILWTAPIATMRTLNPGEKSIINGVEKILVSRLKYVISAGDLKEMKYEDTVSKLVFDGATKRDVEDCKAINVKNFSSEMTCEKNETRKEKHYVLGEIIETMTKEQDDVMRLPETGITVIEGVAGSGKTNMGFHRIVYLLNEFPDKFLEDKIAVFCYNVSLKKYLKNVAKELGIEKINVCSIDVWSKGIIKKPVFGKCIDIDYRVGVPEKIKNIKTVEINKYIQDKNSIISDKINSSKYKDDLFGLLGNIKLDTIAKSYIISAKKAEMYYKNLIKNANIWNRGLFKKLEKEDLKNLEIFFDSIISEFNKIYFIIGDGSIKKLCKEIKEKKNIENFIKIDWETMIKDFYKNLNINDTGIKLSNLSKENCFILIFLAIKIGVISIPKYDHVFVDESQDLSALQIGVINLLHNNSMTLAGDFNQKIYKTAPVCWKDYDLLIPPENLYRLSLSHRTSLENLRFANGIVNNKNDDLHVLKSNLKPSITIGVDENQIIKLIIQQIKDIQLKDSKGSIALVVFDNFSTNILEGALRREGIDCYVAKKDNWEFSNKVAITTGFQTKGLEFDYVIVTDINKFEKTDILNKENLLFVVSTRAKIHLMFYCIKEIPKILANLDRGLYTLEEYK